MSLPLVVRKRIPVRIYLAQWIYNYSEMVVVYNPTYWGKHPESILNICLSIYHLSNIYVSSIYLTQCCSDQTQTGKEAHDWLTFEKFPLYILITFPKNFHNGTKDQGHTGQSSIAKIYLKGAMELRSWITVLENYDVYLKGQSPYAHTPGQVPATLMELSHGQNNHQNERDLGLRGLRFAHMEFISLMSCLSSCH